MNTDNTNAGKGRLDRRTMVKNSGAFMGAGLFGAITSGRVSRAQPLMNVFNVFDFGATGNRDENSTPSVRSAVEACFKAGGGTVYVPPGDYTVGTIELKDNVKLHLEAGATFYLSQDNNDFVQGARTMIYAQRAKNISVTGKGCFDGLAKYEFVDMRGVDPEIEKEINIARVAGIDMRRYYRTGMQTYMFILNDCINVLLQDISVIQSPLWNIRLNDCDRVYVRGVYIFSDLEKGVNADGIDICSSRNVTISDSVIITADDAIVLKTPVRRGQDNVNPVENIVVTNCVLTSSSTPLQIGTETHADIRHVIFSNCTIRNSNKGFGINVQDGATVSDILFSNLTIDTNRRHWNWWGSAEMCKIVLKKRTEKSKLGRIKNILIHNIIAHPRGTSTIRGHSDQVLENIRFNNVQVLMNPEDAKDKRASHAVIIENARDLKMDDFSVGWTEDQTEEGWESALILRNVSGFEIRGFSGRQGLKNSSSPSILLDNVCDGLIAESRATEGCSAFIAMKKDESRNVVLRNNNIKKARTGTEYFT